MKLKNKIQYIESKYNLKVIELDIKNNYIKVSDNDNYKYELKYSNISRFRKSFRNMTKESYIEYFNNIYLKNTNYQAIDLINNKINILNIITGISIWQPKYNFKSNIVESLTTKPSIKVQIIKDKFGNKYDYSNLKYNNNFEKASLICKQHGEFKVKWANLLKDSHKGCPKCTHIGRKFGKKGFIKNCNNLNVKGILYFIKLEDSNEVFYKIGITTNLNNRFKTIPYSKNILLTIEGDPELIYDLEKVLQKKLTSYLYIPIKKFNGRLECFSFTNEKEIKDIILDFSNKLI